MWRIIMMVVRLIYIAPYYKVSFEVDGNEVDYAYVAPVDESTGKYIEYTSIPEVDVDWKTVGEIGVVVVVGAAFIAAIYFTGGTAAWALVAV